MAAKNEALKALENYREECKRELKEIEGIVAKYEDRISHEKRRVEQFESIIVSLEKGIELLKKEK